MNNPMYNLVEKEIEKGVCGLDPVGASVAILLSILELKPLEDLLLKIYKTWWGDGRLRFPPMAMAKAMVYKELKDIAFFQQLISHLIANPEEGRLLGFVGGLPSPQTFSIMKTERLTPEIQHMMNFIAETIRQVAKANGRYLDIDYPAAGDGAGKSRRTVQRHASQIGGDFVRYLIKEVFPEIDLYISDKAKYAKEEFLLLLAYIAYNNMCANGGYQLMREEERFKDIIPHARTLLGKLAKMEHRELMEMYKDAFDVIFRIAKSRGLMPNRYADLAIDNNDTIYYGDTNTTMVIDGKPENGRTGRMRQTTIKIVEKYGDFTLLAIPIDFYNRNNKAVIRELVEYAKQRVRPRYIYADKGFSGEGYISVFEEMSVKYLIPYPKNKKIERIISQRGAPAVFQITVGRKKTKLTIVTRRADNGDIVCFVSNIEPLLLYTADLFSLYKKRWSIETGYRVQKWEFRPKTTSRKRIIRNFYFMFSMLLYNLWVILNAFISQREFNEQVGYRIMTAQLFMRKLCEAFLEYGSP